MLRRAPLLTHGVLGHLDEHLLLGLERVADTPRPLLALRRGHLVDVEEAVLLEAEIDERGIDAAEHALDLALVDVAEIRLLVGALDIDLGEAAVLDQRDAQLLAVIGHQDEPALRLVGDHAEALRRRRRHAASRGRCPRPGARWPWAGGGRARETLSRGPPGPPAWRSLRPLRPQAPLSAHPPRVRAPLRRRRRASRGRYGRCARRGGGAWAPPPRRWSRRFLRSRPAPTRPLPAPALPAASAAAGAAVTAGSGSGRFGRGGHGG